MIWGLPIIYLIVRTVSDGAWPPVRGGILQGVHCTTVSLVYVNEMPSLADDTILIYSGVNYDVVKKKLSSDQWRIQTWII